MHSQVTTRQGDNGTTRTLGGETVSKSHPIVESCGWVDALRTETAQVRLDVMASGRDDAEYLGDFLLWVLHVYFLIGTECNDPVRAQPGVRKAELTAADVGRLEEVQGTMEASLHLPKQFIVSATTPLAADFDHLCTTARALERSVVRLRESVSGFNADIILMFLNRLSDTLYVIARYIEEGRHQVVDYTVLHHPDS